MEIAPILGIRAVPAVKSRPVDPELSAVFDIEASARPGDDTWIRHSRKAAGAEEDEEELDEFEEALQAGEHTTSYFADCAAGRISFFA